MQGHQLGAINKHRFNLNLVDQLRHPLHNLITIQPGGALLHQFGHTAAIAGPLQHQKTQPSHSLRIVELEAAMQASLRQQGRGHDQELVFFLGGEMHAALERAIRLGQPGATLAGPGLNQNPSADRQRGQRKVPPGKATPAAARGGPACWRPESWPIGG